jgi:hypothetical protein
MAFTKSLDKIRDVYPYWAAFSTGTFGTLNTALGLSLSLLRSIALALALDLGSISASIVLR